MKILQYRGRSIISRLIRFQTRSPYSHTAIQFSDGCVIEAWHKGGVRLLSSPLDGHSNGTLIDVYSIDGHVDEERVRSCMEAQIGQKYDFWAIGRFLSRRNQPANNKWFCSELALTAIAKGGLRLLNGNYSHMSPRDVSLSPRLELERTI